MSVLPEDSGQSHLEATSPIAEASDFMMVKVSKGSEPVTAGFRPCTASLPPSPGLQTTLEVVINE